MRKKEENENWKTWKATQLLIFNNVFKIRTNNIIIAKANTDTELVKHANMV